MFFICSVETGFKTTTIKHDYFSQKNIKNRETRSPKSISICSKQKGLNCS